MNLITSQPAYYNDGFLPLLCIAIALNCVFNCIFSLDESNDGPIIETLYEEENEPEYLGEVSGEDIDG